jgi:large subunit ribosomal protein L23
MVGGIAMNNTHLLLIPVISEKAYGQSQANTYVFKVPITANKQQVAAAVATQYGVGVDGVRVVIAKGKVKRTIRGGKPYVGRRTNAKKAYVTLSQGDSIKIFDEVDDSNSSRSAKTSALGQATKARTALGSSGEKQ